MLCMPVCGQQDSKFRPSIQASAQDFISSLKEFECEPDPQFGDKPRDIVRNSAAKITNMLADRSVEQQAIPSINVPNSQFVDAFVS